MTRSCRQEPTKLVTNAGSIYTSFHLLCRQVVQTDFTKCLDPVQGRFLKNVLVEMVKSEKERRKIQYFPKNTQMVQSFSTV